jgi:hypothetical protein
MILIQAFSSGRTQIRRHTRRVVMMVLTMMDANLHLEPS